MENNEIKLNDLSNDLLIINKITIDNLFKLDNCTDCIALYIFYYKTAKWQNTDIIKANDMYIKKSLKWGIDKIQRTKKILKEKGLIDIIQRREKGKISGWYIQINYIINNKSKEEIKIKVEESNNTQNQQVENSTSGFQDTNALKEYIKCLENKIKILNKEKYKKEKIDEEILNQEFEKLWSIYPNKQGKIKALEHFIKARKKGVDFDIILDGLNRYIKYCNNNKNWYRAKNGSTWFNQECWNDDYNIKKEKTLEEKWNEL